VDAYQDWFGVDGKFSPTTDLNTALSQQVKIAAVPYQFELCQPDFPYQQFDLLLISDIEYNHTRPVAEWIAKLGIKNYLLALGGIEHDSMLTEDMLHRPWWMFNLLSKNTFKDYDYLTPKPYKFDILLGAQKVHRNYVMALIQSSGLLERTITTYRKEFVVPDTPGHVEFESATKNILTGQKLLHPYVPAWLDPAWEIGLEIKYSDSDRIPWGILNQTDYTVVTETQGFNSFFPSEKITKALLTKRLFVVFSCYHYLKNLRAMGFKTFDAIIDESYDNIVNDVDRYTAAFEQVKYLINADSTAIKRQILPIIEHNYNRLFEYRQEIREQMLQMIHNKIRKIKDANSIQ
jgi:hypothetical protein